MLPFLKKGFEDLKLCRSAPLPIKKVQDAHVGHRWRSDGECPHAAGRMNYGTRLKTLGVKTELVVYEHEGHNVRGNPEHLRDGHGPQRCVFDEYLHYSERIRNPVERVRARRYGPSGLSLAMCLCVFHN